MIMLMYHTLYCSLGPSLFQGSGLFVLSQLWMKQMSAEMNEACMINLNTTMAWTSEQHCCSLPIVCVKIWRITNQINLNNNHSSAGLFLSIVRDRWLIHFYLLENRCLPDIWVTQGQASQICQRHGASTANENKQWDQLWWEVNKKQNKNKYNTSRMTWGCNKLQKHGWWPSSTVIRNWFCWQAANLKNIIYCT